MKKLISLLVILIVLACSTVYSADLSEFPNFFIKDNNANVVIIVGKAARADDVLGAIDVVVALQQRVGNKKLDIAKMDDEIKILSEQNSIVIGGPCANSAAAKLKGYPDNCLKGFEVGKGYIELYEFDNGNIAMLIAGTAAIDTRRATRVVSNYKDYKLTGKQMVISEVILNDISVNSKS